jgi:hypothetical protein
MISLFFIAPPLLFYTCYNSAVFAKGEKIARQSNPCNDRATCGYYSIAARQKQFFPRLPLKK